VGFHGHACHNAPRVAYANGVRALGKLRKKAIVKTTATAKAPAVFVKRNARHQDNVELVGMYWRPGDWTFHAHGIRVKMFIAERGHGANLNGVAVHNWKSNFRAARKSLAQGRQHIGLAWQGHEAHDHARDIPLWPLLQILANLGRNVGVCKDALELLAKIGFQLGNHFCASVALSMCRQVQGGIEPTHAVTLTFRHLVCGRRNHLFGDLIMCGIVAYIGKRHALPILIEGLKRLEYRGYDSAGVAILNGKMEIAKSIGRVRKLEELVEKTGGFKGTIGIAHTRWATHGGVTDRNAHPHCDDKKLGHNIAIIHNGIIENYSSLKKYLEEKGHTFESETDTEVLAHLIGELYKGDLEKAVQAALREVTGAYAIAAICKTEPDVLVVARKGSPLMVGVGKDEYIVASDSSAIVAHTTQAFTLADYTVAKLTRDSFRTSTVDDVPVDAQVKELEFDLAEIELGDFEHFMLKEIYEQPGALRTCLKGRVDTRSGQIVLGGVLQHAKMLATARSVTFVGQGTALHACMIASYLMEELGKVNADWDYASEFRYRNPIVEEGTVVVAISQSGETADTLAALQEAKQRGAFSLGVVNVVGSTISRETDAGVYLRVGPEIGVASTKAFVGQVMVATMLALFVGRRRYLSNDFVSSFLKSLEQIPDAIERTLKLSDKVKASVAKYIDRENWLFLGRGLNWPVALEGALKLKELSYIHAEGMPAAEMKHGPIALIDNGMPCVFIATKNSQYEKVLSNIQEVRSRGGHVIAIATEGDEHIATMAEEVFYVPDVPELLQPLVTVIPLQLLAYHAAVLRGKDVDKPRNLAKSVTVE